MRRVEAVLWSSLVALGPGCSQEETAAPRTAEVANTGGAPATATGDDFALPQEELARKKDSIKLKGNLIVEGYTEGLLQIDVFRDVEGNQKPITNARFKSPGPFEMFLPAGSTSVQLVAVLDVKSDGPDRADPKGEYSGNPLQVSGTEVQGVDITIDKNNVRPPPPDRTASQGQPQDIDEDDSAGSGEVVIGPDGTRAAAPTGAAPAGDPASPSAGVPPAAPAGGSAVPTAAAPK